MLDPEGKQWFDDLRTFLAGKRAAAPIAPYATLAPAEKLRVDILFGDIRDWFNQGLRQFRANRSFGAALHRLDPDPCVVFTSDPTGLSCIAGMMRQPPEWLAWGLSEEFADFRKTRPDDGYRWHIHYESVLRTAADPVLLATLRRDTPIPDGSEYWVHSISTLFAPNGGFEVAHLWSWDGVKERLLKEAWSEKRF